MDSQHMAPCRIDFGSDADDKERESLPVYLRVKPQDDEEMSIRIINSTTVETNHAFRANKKATFTHVFPSTANQEDIFEGTSAQLIKKFLDGANVMTFAYGVTSSGKTYTIMGNHANPGIIPRTLEIIFGSLKTKLQKSTLEYKPAMFEGVQEISYDEISEFENFKSNLISKVKGSWNSFDHFSFASTTQDLQLETGQHQTSPLPAAMSCSVWISIYEIHNEVVTDLLSTECKSKRKALNIGQDSKGRTFVKNLTQLPVSSAAEAFGLLQFARQNLSKASTKLNEDSSRSHMVFNIRMIHWGGPVVEPLVNQLVISDLAGSERQAKTGTSGMTLKQASAINNSLLVLGRCLEALRKKDKGISAPFRDSKLTRMLNPFFTLGGYVSLIICVNPGMHLQDETIDTIRFSAIASEIVQDPVRPLERLRQLRRLTLGCIENSPMKIVDESTEVQHWQDAVNRGTIHNGVAYLEVRASYFNDMARDILRAEKLLDANEAEITALKDRLKENENVKENIRLMYQDKMKEQREKFSEQRRELEEMHRNLQATLVEEMDEEVRTYKEKYTKYRDGYAKLSEYLKEKLWPEVELFRERFGYLPEYPPKDGSIEEESKVENTIKYWQDKLQEKENEYRSMKKSLIKKSERIANLTKKCDEQSKALAANEEESNRNCNEIVALKAQISTLEDTLVTMKNRFSDYEPLIDEVSELKQALRTVEESREALIAQHQIRFNSVVEELDSIKVELREKDAELEDTVESLAAAEMKIEVLEAAVKDLEKQGQSQSQHEAFVMSDKAKLEQKIIMLESELSKERREVVDLHENLLVLQNEVEELIEVQTQLKRREQQLNLKLQNVRRSKAVEDDIVQLMDDLKRVQAALDEEKEALAEKNILIDSQEAQLEELRDKVATIEILAPQLEKLSEENRDFRDKLKNLQNENKRLEVEVKQTRELEVEVEFLTRKLDNQQKRILREYPQTERISRRRRSMSTSDAELRVPQTTKPRRRLRLGNEENSELDETLRRTIRDPSPTPILSRTRSAKKK